MRHEPASVTALSHCFSSFALAEAVGATCAAWQGRARAGAAASPGSRRTRAAGTDLCKHSFLESSGVVTVRGKVKGDGQS